MPFEINPPPFSLIGPFGLYSRSIRLRPLDFRLSHTTAQPKDPPACVLLSWADFHLGERMESY